MALTEAEHVFDEDSIPDGPVSNPEDIDPRCVCGAPWSDADGGCQWLTGNWEPTITDEIEAGLQAVRDNPWLDVPVDTDRGVRAAFVVAIEAAMLPANRNVVNMLLDNSQLRGELVALKAGAAALVNQITTVTRERDAAILHDRQPYPTAYAYETLAASYRRYRDLADRATRLLVDLANRQRQPSGPEAGALRSEFLARRTLPAGVAAPLAEQLTAAQETLAAMTADRDFFREQFTQAIAANAELVATQAEGGNPA